MKNRILVRGRGGENSPQVDGPRGMGAHQAHNEAAELQNPTAYGWLLNL